MQSTGIVRRVDELGRIVIPIELRRSLNVEPGDALEILVGTDEIILRKFVQTCVFCGNAKNLQEFQNQLICNHCRDELIS